MLCLFSSTSGDSRALRGAGGADGTSQGPCFSRQEVSCGSVDAVGGPGILWPGGILTSDRMEVASLKEVYWFRLPDDLEWLLSLPPSELKSYIRLSRDIQRGKAPGELSIRELARDVGIVFQTAQTAVTSLLDQGRVVAQKSKGRTTVYSLPFTWAKKRTKKKIDNLSGDRQSDGADYSDAGERSGGKSEEYCSRQETPNYSLKHEQSKPERNSESGQSDNVEYSGAGERSEEKSEQYYSPQAERNYSHTDEQSRTIRSSDSSESSESTTTAPAIGTWTPALIEQARELMRRQRNAQVVPDLELTHHVLVHMLNLADLELWLKSLGGIKFKTLWGFHRDNAPSWPTRRLDIQRQVERERAALEKAEEAAKAEWERTRKELEAEEAAA